VLVDPFRLPISHVYVVMAHTQPYTTWAMTEFRRVLAVVVGLLPVLAWAEVVVVSRPSGGSWTLQKVDSITVNGAVRVRRVPAVGAATTWDGKAIGRLAHIDIELLSR
jgi:hypothetical protein